MFPFPFRTDMSAVKETKVFMDQNLQFYLRTKRFIFFIILVAHKTVIGAGRISVTTYTPYVWEGGQ